MTDAEILTEVELKTGCDDTTLLSSYIDDAKSVIINKAFPFKVGITEVPLKYHRRWVEISVYLFNKRGAEGETIHIENGTDRHYENASVPASMLRDIIPVAKIPSPEAEDDENT